MSFMYNPFPYDDPRPVNRPELTENATKSIVAGSAKAAAAHAEMMFSQQQAAFGSVRVIDTGTVYRVVVGNAPSQQEAIALARSVSSALGAKAYAIAEPVPKQAP